MMEIFGKDRDPFAELRRLTGHDWRAIQCKAKGKVTLQMRTEDQDWFDVVEKITLLQLRDVLAGMILVAHSAKLMKTVHSRFLLRGVELKGEELITATKATLNRKRNNRHVKELPNGKREFVQPLRESPRAME